jgi:hypothetical protein
MPSIRREKSTSANNGPLSKYYPDSWAENAKKNWGEAFMDWKESLSRKIQFIEEDLKNKNSKSPKK